MDIILAILIACICVGTWIGSMVAIIDKWAKNNVPTNLLSVLILLCPIINTLLALYYVYPEYKKTLSKIFKNN